MMIDRGGVPQPESKWELPFRIIEGKVNLLKELAIAFFFLLIIESIGSPEASLSLCSTQLG